MNYGSKIKHNITTIYSHNNYRRRFTICHQNLNVCGAHCQVSTEVELAGNAGWDVFVYNYLASVYVRNLSVLKCDTDSCKMPRKKRNAGNISTMIHASDANTIRIISSYKMCDWAILENCR